MQACKDFYPQYIQELQGIADGAGLPFENIFMLNVCELPLINPSLRATNNQTLQNLAQSATELKTSDSLQSGIQA